MFLLQVLLKPLGILLKPAGEGWTVWVRERNFHFFWKKEKQQLFTRYKQLFSFCSFLHLKADLSFTVVLKLFTG